MRMLKRGRSHVAAAVSGAAVAFLLATVCVYMEAFGWASSRGMLLDATVRSAAYTTPAFSWAFIVAAGLVCALAAVWLVRKTVATYRLVRLRSAAATGAVFLVAAITAHATSPGGWSLEALTFVQRGGYFIATSGAYIAFVGFTVMWTASKYVAVRLSLDDSSARPLGGEIGSDATSAK